MIKQYRFISLLLVIFLLGGTKMIEAQDALGKISCICIDAGHGGRDPGAVSGRLKEKDITLAVALKLGKMIQDAYPDMKIVYTRKKDVAVDLRERGRIANKANAQLFISIHVNKFAKSSVRGVETYVLGLHKSDASFQVAMKENEAIHYEEDYTVKYDGFDPKKAESYIMFNFLKNSHLKNSMKFAAPVQKELVGRTRMPNREVRQAGFIVLMDVGMPAVLIETGFLSNPNDQKILTSESGQTNIAKAIFAGFKAYKNNVERNSVIIKGEAGRGNDRLAAEEKTTEGVVASNKNDLFYAVQIASSKTKVKDFKYLKLKEKVEELKGGSVYRYYVGRASTYGKALEKQQEVRKRVKDCFIIAIYRSRQITIAEARAIEQKK